MIVSCLFSSTFVLAESYDSDVVISMQINNPIMEVNGQKSEIDTGNNTTPVISNGRTLVPIRAIIEAFNGNVYWDGNTQTVTLKIADNCIILKIGAMYHCVCNYIPKAALHFDMGDLCALIAPRPIVVVCGSEDKIFPLHGVKETFDTIQKIYKKAGAQDNCSLVIGEGGHRFYANPSWDILRKYNIL